MPSRVQKWIRMRESPRIMGNRADGVQYSSPDFFVHLALYRQAVERDHLDNIMVRTGNDTLGRAKARL